MAPSRKSTVPVLFVSILAIHSAAGYRLPSSNAHLGTESGLGHPREAMQIHHIPGYEGGGFSSNHYAGYIPVGSLRHLYFYFVESQGDPTIDPVLLWLNGGPGCSSLDGFIYEHGPFLARLVCDVSSSGGAGGEDGKDGDIEGKGSRKKDKGKRLVLDDNPYTWSKVASIIYLDSPANVGFSYSSLPGDRERNDTQTAADVDTFLRAFFSPRYFPELARNDFYVTGESYGGVYVPMVARAVLHGNKAGAEPKIELRGIMVGNGVTDAEFDGNAIVPFAAGKSLISEKLFASVALACNGAFWNATEEGDCGMELLTVQEGLRGLNIYDILKPCYTGSNPYYLAGSGRTAPSRIGRRKESAEQRPALPGWPALGPVRQGLVPGFRAAFGLPSFLSPEAADDLTTTKTSTSTSSSTPPTITGTTIASSSPLSPPPHLLGHTPPCLDSREMWAYANDPGIRKAVHARSIEEIGWFDECTNGQRIEYTHNAGSMIPVHLELLDAGKNSVILLLFCCFSVSFLVS
jgi:serine carboxypeptidase-like clade I